MYLLRYVLDITEKRHIFVDLLILMFLLRLLLSYELDKIDKIWDI